MKKQNSHQPFGISRWNLIVITTAILIAWVTLFPFNFTWKVGFSLEKIFRYFHHPSNLIDFIANIGLFIPFSFGVTGWLRSHRLSAVITGISVILLSLSFSLTVEVLQIFLPARSPTYADIVANTLGGLGGWLVFYLWRVV